MGDEVLGITVESSNYNGSLWFSPREVHDTLKAFDILFMIETQRSRRIDKSDVVACLYHDLLQGKFILITSNEFARFINF